MEAKEFFFVPTSGSNQPKLFDTNNQHNKWSQLVLITIHTQITDSLEKMN